MSEWLQDTEDFGLAPGEAFEPALPPEPAFDLARPHIMTVLGPIAPEELGLVVPHEHLIATLPTDVGGTGERFADEHVALAELEDFYVVGGRALVEATPEDWGRDLAAVHWIAARSPVVIIGVTGAGGPPVPDMRVDELAGRWINELRNGVGEQQIRPGVIVVEAAAGEIALRAAVQAQQGTGAPIMTTMPLPLVRRLVREEGGAPRRVMLGVAAERLDDSAVREALAAGFWLMIDVMGGDEDGDARLTEAARHVCQLLAAGFAGQLLCAPHLGRRADWRSGGGEGWGMMIERWPLALMTGGADASTVRQLLVDNPAEALAVRQ